MNRTNPNWRKKRESLLLGSRILWETAIKHNAIEEVMKRNTAISIGLKSTRGA
jgi:hypothetical protein